MDKSTVVSILGTVVRYGLVYLIAKGYLPQDLDPGQVVGAVVTIGTVAYAGWKTYDHKSQIAAAK